MVSTPLVVDDAGAHESASLNVRSFNRVRVVYLRELHFHQAMDRAIFIYYAKALMCFRTKASASMPALGSGLGLGNTMSKF